LDQWLVENSHVRDHIMALLCLLGTRYDALHAVGFRLVSKVTTTSDSDGKELMGPIEGFFRFVRDLERSLSGSHDVVTSDLSLRNSNTWSEIMTACEYTSGAGEATDQPDSFKQGLSRKVAATGDSTPRACSYVLKSGFHAQHWYNCYTCGLVWDKGCCSLCALICHQGHDVAYSRHSSFFCDCGGEAPTHEENRVPCKCLTSIDSGDAEKLFNEEEWALLNGPLDESECVSSDSEVACTHSEDSELYTSAARVASSRLERYARFSLDRLKTEAVRGNWTSSLFELLRSHRQLWSLKDKELSHADYDVTNEELSTATSALEASSVRSLVLSLHGRNGKTSNLELLPRQALVPLRSFRTSSFQLGLSNDITMDRVKRAMLSKNSIMRRALVADCRGRMIVAEPSSLLFCAVLPSVNVRYEEKSAEVPCGRAQMSILGSSPMQLNIVGMELCRENERHLAVWGTTEASVVILSKGCDKVERTIELMFELEPDECEVDYLVKCAWVPGSQTIVVVACGPFVKLFDLRLAEEDKANSLASYSFAYEAVLRDVALVPTPSAESHIGTSRPTTPATDKVKLFVLLDIGHLLTIDLNFDESGQLKEQGDMYIESGEGISFPIGGVHMNHSTQIVSADTKTRTLGEGSSLVFLPKSGVLLYACASSSVVALLLDATGNVTWKF
jgi:Putative zinc finger in N-recognin (UBR box)